MQSAMAASEKIFSVLDDDTIIKNEEKVKQLNKIKGEVEFKNVTFAYNEGENVLRDVSFKIANLSFQRSKWNVVFIEIDMVQMYVNLKPSQNRCKIQGIIVYQEVFYRKKGSVLIS